MMFWLGLVALDFGWSLRATPELQQRLL